MSFDGFTAIIQLAYLLGIIGVFVVIFFIIKTYKKIKNIEENINKLNNSK